MINVPLHHSPLRHIQPFLPTFTVMTVVGGLLLMAPTISWAQGTTIAANVPTRSQVQLGSQGADVKELQGILKLMGLYRGPIDGQFREGTLAAVKQFQQLAGLIQDGVVGSGTWAKLLPPAPGETPATVIVPAAPVATTPRPEPAPEPVAEPILRLGAEGPAVARLQRRLRAIGVYDGEIDGGFGEVTELAVRAAQRRAGLEDDGIVGPATWDAIR